MDLVSGSDLDGPLPYGAVITDVLARVEAFLANVH